MIQARAWPVRAMYILIVAALAISLFITAGPAQKVSSDCTADVCAEWDKVSTPTMDDWVLTPESEIIDYALAEGGDVAYAIVEAYDENPWDDEDDAGNPSEWYEYEYRLLKSEDGAATWADLTDALDDVIDPDNEDLNYIEELVLVGTDWVDPDFVAVAVWWYDDDLGYYILSVFISTDGGDNFIDAGEVEESGVYFDDPDDVSDLAVSYEATGKRDIAVAGMDWDGYSALFRCTVTGDTPGPWRDTTEYEGWDDDTGLGFNPDLMGLGYVSYLVTDIIFSPDWATDRTILAVTFCGYGAGPSGYEYGAIHLQSGAWGATTGNWNLAGDFEDAVLVKKDVYFPMFLADDDGRGIAGVVLPEDYSGTDPDTRYAWVWVNYFDSIAVESVGEILRVRNGAVDAVDTQITGMPWLTNVSYWGTIAEGKAIAGVLAYSQPYDLGPMDLIKPCCEGVQVYRNAGIANMEICCLEWDEACKPPTGRTSMAVSYVSDDKAYAVALHDYIEDGDEDAWSVSFDDGDTWNQLSLIDTYISYVSDVAVSPDCNKKMLVTVAEDIWAWDQYDPSYAPWECYILYDTGTPDYYDVRFIYCDSVWVYADTFPEAGFDYYSGHWLRTWCGPLLGDNTDLMPFDMERGLLRLAPEENDGMTVYLVDRMTDTIYWNELETLACWKTRSSAAGGIDEIVDLAVKDEATIYALDWDGGVAMSDDHGASLTWTESVKSEVNDGWTIAVHTSASGNVTDILVGGQDADVGHSDDGGATFTALEDIPTPTNGSDNVRVTVAFDTYFDTNDTIYAALAHAYYDNGIYLWVIGADPELWHRTDAKPYNYTGLVLDRPSPSNPYTSPETGGVLYASYYTRVPEELGNCDYCGCDYEIDGGDYECWHSGVARCLTPITELCCGVGEAEWDYLTWGLDGEELFYMVPQALKICGCLTSDSNSRLYVVDGYDVDESYDAYDMVDGEFGAVWTFEDCYAKKAVELVSPADGFVVAAAACDYCGNSPFAIKWDRLCDACCYEIQFARDEDFTDLVDPYYYMDDSIYWDCYCPPTPTSPSVWVGPIFDPEFTYYWRIRASQAETCQEIHSWWSEPLSFTVSPTSAAGAISLVSPVPGAQTVGTKNVGFSWNLLASADAFDWVLSKNADLTSPVESKTALTSTAYTCTKTLDYGTTYYWQVTAYKGGAAISASAVGTFTTAPTGAFCCPVDGLCFDTEAALKAHTAEAHGGAGATPFWVWVVIAIGAVLVIVVIVLIFRTRRV